MNCRLQIWCLNARVRGKSLGRFQNVSLLELATTWKSSTYSGLPKRLNKLGFPIAAFRTGVWIPEWAGNSFDVSRISASSNLLPIICLRIDEWMDRIDLVFCYQITQTAAWFRQLNFDHLFRTLEQKNTGIFEIVSNLLWQIDGLAQELVGKISWNQQFLDYP